MKFARLGFLLAAPLLLASCLFTPGRFVSTLDIKADRSFTFTYVGEVIFTDPAEAMEQGAAATTDTPSDDDPEDDMEAEDGTGAAPPPPPAAAPAVPQPETPARFAERKALAESLSREAGYRSVEYLGNGRFRVDYSISSRLDRGFLFPINLDAKAILPWVVIEVRRDNTARVTGLAFGDSDSGPGGMAGAAGMGKPDKPQAGREGTFTLTTDAALVMQNNEEGMAPGPGTRIVWKVTPTSKTVPTAVVRFAR